MKNKIIARSLQVGLAGLVLTLGIKLIDHIDDKTNSKWVNAPRLDAIYDYNLDNIPDTIKTFYISTGALGNYYFIKERVLTLEEREKYKNEKFN